MLIQFEDKSPALAVDVFVAPTAAIIGDVEIKQGASVWFGTVIRGDYGPIRIGKGCSIQDNAVVHVNHTADGKVFPTVIEDNCIIGHGAVVEGCRIGNGCLIGMKAVILPNTKIGDGCIVAAGAVIKEGEEIPPYSMLAGAPAVIKRTFDGPLNDVAWAVNEYRQLSFRYQTQTKVINSDG